MQFYSTFLSITLIGDPKQPKVHRDNFIASLQHQLFQLIHPNIRSDASSRLPPLPPIPLLPLALALLRRDKRLLHRLLLGDCERLQGPPEGLHGAGERDFGAELRVDGAEDLVRGSIMQEGYERRVEDALDEVDDLVCVD
jgi:hypothetical protein